MPPSAAHHRRGVRASNDNTRSSELFNGCSFVLTLLLFPMNVCSQNICPSDQRYCNVSSNGASILWMQCDGYGSMNSLPVSCSDWRPISALKVGRSNTLVTTLQAHILDGLQVQQLDLSGLGIRSIDQIAFDALGLLLSQLILSNNNITSLPDNVFISLNRLTTLDLSYNKLTTIGYPAIYGLFQVTSLDLSHNQLKNLLQDTFSAMVSLRTLSLNDNLLTQLPGFLFNNLGTLLELHLQNNRISSITSNSLSGMPNLVLLNMTGNALPTLPLGIFDAVGNLQTLLVANNAIKRVNQNPFQSQRNLIALDLSNNLIEEVTPDWFTAAAQTLQTLQLNGNRILAINVTSLSSALPALVQLNLRGNLLTSVNAIFTNWQSLRHLDISRNPLGLRNGGLGLTESFTGMMSLRSLDLSGSCLTSLEPGLQLPNLENLLLSDNLLTNVSRKMLTGVSGLSKLDISGNSLALIEPSSFTPLSRLVQLNVSGNFLTGNQLQSAGISPNATVDVSWNAVTSVESVPRQNGGVYLHGNPLVCSGCGTGRTSNSWWPADSRLMSDSDQINCLQNNNLPLPIMCQCASTSSASSCNVPLSTKDTAYLFGVQRLPGTCSYDVNILNPNRPRFAGLSARPLTQSSIVVAWNVTDRRSIAVAVEILVAMSTSCSNTSAAINISDLTTFVSKSVYSINETFCDVMNLTSLTTYAVCGEVLIPSTSNSNDTVPTDSLCTCVVIPDVPTTLPPTTTAPPTTLQPRPSISIRATPGENSLTVVWNLNGSSLAFEDFLLTYNQSSGVLYQQTVRTNTDSASSLTIVNLVPSTAYNVCVAALSSNVISCMITVTLPSSQTTAVPNVFSSEAESMTSLSSESNWYTFSSSFLPTSVAPEVIPSTSSTSNMFLIIVIAAPIGAFLLVLIIVICVVVILCTARRRKRLKSPQPQNFVPPVQPPPIVTSPKMTDVTPTTDISDDNSLHLAEQTHVSLSIYDLTDII